MKKIILVCGLISGIIVSVFMVSSIAVCYSSSDFEGNMLLGYAAMLLSFSLIFVGVKNFRDKYNGGFVSFGKAFQIGLLITLIASTVYVIVWLIDYYLFVPEFIEKQNLITILSACICVVLPSSNIMGFFVHKAMEKKDGIVLIEFTVGTIILIFWICILIFINYTIGHYFNINLDFYWFILTYYFPILFVFLISCFA